MPDGVSVQVCQATTGQVFITPLEISFQSSDGTTRMETIMLDQLQEQVTYSLPFTVTGLQVDPNQKLLADTSTSQVDALAACAP